MNKLEYYVLYPQLLHHQKLQMYLSMPERICEFILADSAHVTIANDQNFLTLLSNTSICRFKRLFFYYCCFFGDMVFGNK